jgi:hypothetical protein
MTVTKEVGLELLCMGEAFKVDINFDHNYSSDLYCEVNDSDLIALIVAMGKSLREVRAACSAHIPDICVEPCDDGEEVPS